MAESRHVLCCRVKRWTAVIAWLQIVISTIFVLSSFGMFILLCNLEEEKVEEILDEMRERQVEPFAYIGYGILLLSSLFFMVVFIVALIMGIVLHKGARKRIIKYLNAWIVYMMICLLIDVIWKLVTLDISSIIGVLRGLGGIVASILFVSFLLWLVHTYKNEIVADRIRKKLKSDFIGRQTSSVPFLASFHGRDKDLKEINGPDSVSVIVEPPTPAAEDKQDKL